MASAQQIANGTQLLGPLHKVLRYAKKILVDRAGDTEWENSELSLRVKTNGQLDLAKIKTLFVDRNICTDVEFDAAMTEAQNEGLLNSQFNFSGPKAMQVYNLLEERWQARCDEVSARYPDAIDWALVATKAEMDYVNGLTDTLI